MHTHLPITLHDPADLTLEVFIQIVWEGRPLALHPTLLARIGTAREEMRAALAGGHAVYGVNTGMGYLATVRLSEAEQQQHQANLLLGRAVGGAPFLERDEARAVLLARLAGFLSGHAGVSPALCQFLVARLNDEFVPAIPRSSIGCAGEIIPLSHAFQTFMGMGQVLLPDGTPAPADVALAERGVPPYQPEIKEGIALLAGAPGAVALTIAHHRQVSALARQLLVAAACAIDALGAPLGPYDPALAALGNDPVLEGMLLCLGDLLAGSRPDRRSSQAPVSFRVIPQVLAHLVRTLGWVERELRRNLGAVTDSPVFVEGRFLTSGAFHAIDLTSFLDWLGQALTQAAELAGQHIHRLLDHRFSGLPDQLSPQPGPQAGLIVVHKRVVGTLHELRRLATPTGIGLVDTSLGQEDAVSFGFAAADKLRQVEDLMREVVACELLVCRQAWALRDEPVAEGLREHFRELGAIVAPLAGDRPLGGDIATLIDRLREGRFQ